MKGDGHMGGMAQIPCGKVVYPPGIQRGSNFAKDLLSTKHFFTLLQVGLIFNSTSFLAKAVPIFFNSP